MATKTKSMDDLRSDVTVAQHYLNVAENQALRAMSNRTESRNAASVVHSARTRLVAAQEALTKSENLAWS